MKLVIIWQRVDSRVEFDVGSPIGHLAAGSQAISAAKFIVDFV
jgi:hypothetical protein